MTDEDLVGLARKDPDFFVHIIERYETKILRYIKRMSSSSRETAEDLGQETFVKAYLKLNQFDQKLKFSSWLYRIAHNHVISHWRKHKKEKDAMVYWHEYDHYEKILESDDDMVGEMDQRLLQQQLTLVLNKLRPVHKEVLILKYLEDHDYQEISDIIKKPIGSVGVLISRAKAELRDKLNKEVIYQNEPI